VLVRQREEVQEVPRDVTRRGAATRSDPPVRTS
jgi:hypothetical protein